MAINKDDVSIRVSAVNETSKPLKEARADFERFEDSVKAAASALDEHKGHPRQFANAMKSAFTPLAGIAKNTVDKLSESLDGLEHDLRAVEDAMSFKDVQLDGFRKSKAAIDAEREAVEHRLAAEKMAAKQSAEAAKARASEISAAIKARQADVREMDKQIAAEQRLHDRTEQRLIKNRKTLEEPKRLSAKRQQALEEASVDDANALAASRNRMAQLVRARAASAAIVAPLLEEQQAHKDLTAVAKREAGERISVVKAEEDAIKKRDRALESSIKSATLERNTMAAKRDAIIQDRSDVSDLRGNAVRLQSQLRDPTDVRRVAKSITDGPAREARGMAALSAETRRSADAQRLLNGETRSGVPLFASLRSELMALIGVYALYSTTVSQASKVVDAFNTKEAFTVAVGSAGGSADDALAQWDYLTKTANKYKFAISGISDEYSKLVINSRGAGLTDDETRVIFEGVLAKARATNLTTEQIQNAFRALNQTVSKGQLYSEELKGQLAEAIPGAVTDMARALGYGADQMKQFSKDLEAGAFGAEAVVKYADYLMSQNSGAVEAAGNTFKAAVADLQNVLFETRLKLAEGGFMDGMKDTVQELADFFKSDEGQAYLIRLADAANGVVKAMAAVARNLDLVITGLGALAGIKILSTIGRVFASMAGAATAAKAGMTAMAGSAGALATALGVLRVAGAALLRLMGGIPGLALSAAAALWSWSSSENAEKAAQAQSRLDRVRDVIGEIRSAAKEADGDVSKFIKSLAAIQAMTGAQQLSIRQDIVQSKADVRDKFWSNWHDARKSGLSESSFQVLTNATMAGVKGGPIDRKRLNSDLDELVRSDQKTLPYVLALQKLLDELEALESAQTEVNDAIKAAGGDAATASAQMKRNADETQSSAVAAQSAADAQREFEDSLKKTSNAAGDTDGYDDYADAMSEAEELRKESMKALDKWIEKQKQAGRALSADEIARQTARINDLFGKMTSQAIRDLNEFQMAARGLNVELDAVSSNMLNAYREREQLGQTQLDPLGTMGGSGNGRRYGQDKRAVAIGIADTAKALGISAEDLATVISYETGGTFDPLKRGPTTQHGQHRGLIQFGVPQARENGVNWDDPVNSQLGPDGAIARYLRKAGVKPGMGILDVYSAINAGRVGRYNASDANNGGAPGTVRDKVEKQMGGHRANARSLLGDYASGTTTSVQDRELSVHISQNISTTLSEQAKLAVQHAGIDNPAQWQNPDFVAAYEDGDSARVAEFIRGYGDSARADEVIRTSTGTEAVRQIEYGQKLAEEAKKRAEEQAKFNQSSDKSVRNARQEAELAGVLDEREKARLRARQQIANEQEDAGFTYTAAQIAAREAAEMAKFDAERSAEAAKSRREQVLADEKMTRDSQNRVTLASEQNEIERERLSIRQRLLDQERESGVARTDAQRNALVEQEMAAFMAERGNQIREGQLQAQLSELQTQLALMEQKAADAVASGNFDERDRLRGQIVGIRTEIVNAIKALEEFYRKMGGPEGRQGLLNMEKLRLETQRGTAEFQRMTPEVQSIAGVIEGNLNAAVSNFSQMVADGMKPWDALKQTVKQAVGQILIDIGQMIVRAVIARAVMSALGMSPSGQAGPLNSTAQALGNMTTMPGGQFHEGGIAGDPNRSIDFISGLVNLKKDEVPAILQVGEEVLTKQDPRHRRNVRSGVSRFMRFHTGGVIGLEPDAVSSSLAAAGSASRSISASMTKAVSDAPAPVVNNNNYFDFDDALSRHLSTPAGERSVMNVITKNRRKVRGLSA